MLNVHLERGPISASPMRARTPKPRRRDLPSTRHAKLSVYLLAGTGFALWEPLALPWSVASPVLVVHVLASLVLIGAVIAPYWWQHRRRLRSSRRGAMRASGRALEIALALLAGSGLYVFLLGNRGDLAGWIADQLHLWLTLALLALLAVHLMRASPVAPLGRSSNPRRSRARRSPA